MDIDFAISGPDLQELAGFSEKLREKASRIPGIVDTDITLRLNKPELLIDIDRERAATLGVDVSEIAQTVRMAIGGDDRVSRYRDPLLDDVYDVELRLVGIDRESAADIAQLYVPTSPSQRPTQQPRQPIAAPDSATRGSVTRLNNVVHFHVGESSARIDRLDRERMASLRANIAPGFALGDRIDAVRQAAEELGMPAAYNTRIMGRGRELERTLQDFQWTFILSFIFMYIVLAAQFEHLVHPLTILFSLPLAVPFGLLSLWLGGESLNLYSALGILVLFGLIKKASILQVDHTNQLRERGLGSAGRHHAGEPRPVAADPDDHDCLRGRHAAAAAGNGPGAEERRSIAVLAVGGQTLSLLLTLLAVPVVYSILDDLGNLFRRKRPRTTATATLRAAENKSPPWREVRHNKS